MTVRSIPITEVVPGAVLGEDLLDAGGHVLLHRGTRLSEGTIASLKRREVAEVSLEVPSTYGAEQLSARRMIITEDLNHRLRLAGDGEATRMVARAVLEYLLEKHSCMP